MAAITATAPGKIILFGEHAVVYGQPAIAIPVNQVHARAVVTPGIGQPRGTIKISAPDINLSGVLADLPLDHALNQTIQRTLASLGVTDPPAFAVKVSSTIPLAAGLGSGAAVSVAVARAVAGFLSRPLSDDEVNQIAFEVEKIHHGTPSGIDNTVITYNKPVFFIKDQPLETFTPKESFTIVIGDTGISSSTAVTVADVRKKATGKPAEFEGLFAECGTIAEQARHAIENGSPHKLGPLMNANHELLQRMTVSSPELDALVTAAQDAGALGAKLSGGGRGGNMIALVETDSAEKVAKTLINAGATNTIITTVLNE